MLCFFDCVICIIYPTLIVIGCVFAIAVVIAFYSFVSKGKFKQKVDAVAAKTRQLSAASANQWTNVISCSRIPS